MNRFLYILISSVLLLIACAPKVQERQFDAPKLDFGPQSQDTKLNLRVREYNQAPPELKWDETTSTAEFFNQIETLSLLSEKMGKDTPKKKAMSWLQKFYQGPESSTRTSLSRTPFAGLATAQTQDQVLSTLDQALAGMEDARPILKDKILELGHTLPTAPHTDLAATLYTVQHFNYRLIEALPRMGLSEVVSTGIQMELALLDQDMFKDAYAILREVLSSKTLTEILNIIEFAVKKFEVILPEETLKSIKDGRAIAKGLDEMYDAQSALSVIVDLWKMLTPQERIEKFKPSNEELYGFLVKQDDKELQCLRTRGCNGGFFNGIAKKIFILPKIKKYGVSTLKKELNQTTREYVLATLLQFGNDQLKTLPQAFIEKIDAAIVDKANRVLKVRNSYPTYVDMLFKEWSNVILPDSNGTIPGFETSTIALSISNKQDSMIKPLPSAPHMVDGKVIGSSLTANVLYIEQAPDKDRMAFQSILSQVNKLVAISGYRNTTGQIVTPLLSPVAHKGKLLDILDLDDSKDPKYSFRIPDHVKLKDSFHASPEMEYAKDFSASAYAQQIKGLSSMMRLMADWRKTKFDNHLGPILAQDISTDAQDEALRQPLFPKDLLFALNLGNTAVLLQEILKDATPVFMMTLSNKILWGNAYSKGTNETPAMVGLVDIVQGKKSDTVHTQDVAQFLLSVSDFLSATEGVENTKSPVLLKPDAKGEVPLQVLLQGKKDLKLLIIGLANYLSHELLKDDMLVKSQHELSITNSVMKSEQKYKVIDQSLAIRALLEAYRLTKINSYLWSAQQIYFGMNKKMFNAKDEFYRDSDGSELSFPDRMTTLLALSELREHLNETSLKQLDRVLEPWLKAVEDLH